MRVVKQAFTQEPHSCLSDTEGDPAFEIELMDAGAGEYAVITAKNWAVDCVEEVDMLADEVKAMLRKAKRD